MVYFLLYTKEIVDLVIQEERHTCSNLWDPTDQKYCGPLHMLKYYLKLSASCQISMW